MLKLIAILLLLCAAVMPVGARGPAGRPASDLAAVATPGDGPGSPASDGAEDAPAKGVYNVVARDQDGQPVPGVAVTFCDMTCQRYITDDEGVISFTGEPARYSLKISGAPDGYGYDPTFDAVCDGSGEWVTVPVVRE